MILADYLQQERSIRYLTNRPPSVGSMNRYVGHILPPIKIRSTDIDRTAKRKRAKTLAIRKGFCPHYHVLLYLSGIAAGTLH